VATPAGGITDFLFDPDKTPDKAPTGLLAEIDNPKDLARQLSRAISSDALVQEITVNAKKMVIQKYDWDNIAKDMKEKVFDKVLK